jgi:hypothetical protein
VIPKENHKGEDKRSIEWGMKKSEFLIFEHEGTSSPSIVESYMLSVKPLEEATLDYMPKFGEIIIEEFPRVTTSLHYKCFPVDYYSTT